MLNRLLAILTLSFGLVLGAQSASAGNQLSVALSGYDTVSYHDGTPMAGEARINHFWNGAIWYFTSTENRDMFAADPAKYAPAYGGYCAWAIGANDRLAPGAPNVYEIVDGTLYLNFSADGQDRWEKDIPGFITKGDANYPTHSADEHYKQQS